MAPACLPPKCPFLTLQQCVPHLGNLKSRGLRLPAFPSHSFHHRQKASDGFIVIGIHLFPQSKGKEEEEDQQCRLSNRGNLKSSSKAGWGILGLEGIHYPTHISTPIRKLKYMPPPPRPLSPFHHPAQGGDITLWSIALRLVTKPVVLLRSGMAPSRPPAPILLSPGRHPGTGFQLEGPERQNKSKGRKDLGGREGGRVEGRKERWESGRKGGRKEMRIREGGEGRKEGRKERWE
ncbi:hypothetical protein L345_09918, partial [Ophiophagus hannah]